MSFFRNKFIYNFFLFFTVFLSVITVTLTKDYFVSPLGNDSNPGTKILPFKTPEKARDIIRENKITKQESATVWFLEGRYFRDTSFELNKEDSGTVYFPVIYRALPGNKVYWDYGTTLSGHTTVSDPMILRRLSPRATNNIMEIDLKNIKEEDLGSYGPRGFGRRKFPAPAELFINGEPQTVARWPNNTRVKLGNVIDKGSVPRNGDPERRGAIFEFTEPRVKLWSEAEDLYISGIFSVSYADDAIKVSKIDYKESTITMATSHLYGFSNKPYTSWYAVNLLEEIDSPREYFIDKKSNKIYFYPSTDKIEIIQLSKTSSPMVVMNDCSNITFRGIIFENSRGDGIIIKNGSKNHIVGCTVRLIGGIGVDVDGGTEHQILSSDIYYTGAGGVSLIGGNRKTLTPSSHMVKNSDIHHVNRWYKTYRPCINLDGVGQKVINNHLHDVPGQAVMFYGNDHLIEYNEINDCVTDMSDMAAIYTGRNPSVMGIIIRYNFFHHLENHIGSGNGVQAIYFDDDDLYTAIIFGNVFYKAGSNAVIHFNGGGGSSIGNNIFIDSPTLIWGGEPKRVLKAIKKMHDPKKTSLLKKIFKDVDIRRDPFKTRYPYLLESYMNFFNIGTPKWNNIIVKSNEENLINHFVDPKSMNFLLKSDSTLFKLTANNVSDPVYGLSNDNIQFQPIPFNKIGLYNDSYRPNY